MITTKTCLICHETMPIWFFGSDKQRKDGFSLRCKTCNSKHAHAWKEKNPDKYLASKEREKLRHRSNPLKQMLLVARRRAKSKNIPFSITSNDVVFPQLCPILGTKLVVGIGRPNAESPSLDRIFPELGYVPGNVRVISHKANTIKSNANVWELMAVANDLRILHNKKYNASQ